MSRQIRSISASPTDCLARNARALALLRVEQLMVVGVVEQRRQRDDIPVTARLALRNAHSVAVHPQGVRGIVPARVVLE